jgi:hypothetical protein
MSRMWELMLRTLLLLVIPTERQFPREWRNLLFPLLGKIIPSRIVPLNQRDRNFHPQSEPVVTFVPPICRFYFSSGACRAIPDL